MKQIEKIGRAQKGSYDSCPDLAAGKDPSPHKVTEREEYSPNQGGKRQETMVVGPAQKTSHMGNDEPNKTDIAAKTNSKAGQKGRPEKDELTPKRNIKSQGSCLLPTKR